MLSVVPYSPYVLTWLSYLVIYQPYPWSCRWRVTTVFLHATCAKSKGYEPLISQGQHIMFPWISLLIQLSKGTTLANTWRNTIHMTFLCTHTTGCFPKLLRSMTLLQCHHWQTLKTVWHQGHSSPLLYPFSLLSFLISIWLHAPYLGKHYQKFNTTGWANSRGLVRGMSHMNSQRPSGKESAHSQHHLVPQFCQLMEVKSLISRKINTSAQLICGPFGCFILAPFYCGDNSIMWSIMSILFSHEAVNYLPQIWDNLQRNWSHSYWVCQLGCKIWKACALCSSLVSLYHDHSCTNSIIFRFYYQHDTGHISACPVTIHTLLHIANSI